MAQSLKDQFAGEVEQFILDSGIDPTTFGKGALRDPNFVFELRKGRAPNVTTIDKVCDFIETYHKAQQHEDAAK
jgi:predicted transcriptional regulator